MDIHIDKKMAIAIIISLVVGGVIGGAAGFAGGMEGGDHGERHGMRMQDERMGYDNQRDGETNDDAGGVPNSDEQQPAIVTGKASLTAPVPASVPTQTP